MINSSTSHVRQRAAALCVGLLSFVVLWGPIRGLGAENPSPAEKPTGAFSTEGSSDAEDVRRELDEILSQPAFRRIRHNQMESDRPSGISSFDWLAKPFRWLWDWLTAGAKALSGLGGIWLVLAYTALAVICALIVWLIVRAVNSFRRSQAVLVTRTLRPDEGELDLPPGDIAADEYRRRASEFAASGRYREAIGQLILGAMSWIERHGLIRFRRGLTHRDYLRSLRSREPLLTSFRTLVGVYEPICFGRRPALSEQYQAAESAYSRAFEGQRSLEAAETR